MTTSACHRSGRTFLYSTTSSNGDRSRVRPQVPRRPPDLRDLPASGQQQSRHFSDGLLSRIEHAQHLHACEISLLPRTIAAAKKAAHHDIDQIAVYVPLSEVGQKRRVLRRERRLRRRIVVARVGKEHVADEKLRVRACRRAQSTQDPALQVNQRDSNASPAITVEHSPARVVIGPVVENQPDQEDRRGVDGLAFRKSQRIP